MAILDDAVVRVPVLSMKKEPADSAENVDELLYGMKVRRLERGEKEWIKVETDYHYEGYCCQRGLLCEEWAVRKYLLSPKLMVHRLYTDVLAAPNIRACRQTTLVKGTLIALGKECIDKDWIQVNLTDGQKGYVRSSSLKGAERKMNEQVVRKHIVDDALMYSGVQYRWGGKSSYGMDCSGLCSLVYLMHGFTINRDSEWIKGGTVKKIPLQQALPADLLYFPGHIALYLGDGKYIHATGKAGSDGVVINSLNSDDPDFREDLYEMLMYAGTVF